MAKVFILPDGTRVREGSIATVARKMARVEPAKTKRDDDGNERIVTPAREVIEQQEFNTTYAALAGMKARELELFGVKVAEAAPEHDPRFFTSVDGPISAGVATRKRIPRPLRDVKAMLDQQVKDEANRVIQERFSITDQINETSRRLGLSVGEISKAEGVELAKLRANRAWIDGVLDRARKLRAQVASLKTVEAASKWVPRLK